MVLYSFAPGSVMPVSVDNATDTHFHPEADDRLRPQAWTPTL